MKKFCYLMFISAITILLAFSCINEDSSSGPDYSNVSVETVTVDSLSSSYSGRDVTGITDFEDNVLGPMMDVFITSEMVFSMGGNYSRFFSNVPSRALVTITDESLTESETIDFSTTTDDPFDTGILSIDGSYSILMQQDDETGRMVGNGSIDVESELTDATAPIMDDFGYTTGTVTLAGLANVNGLANFDFSMTQTSETSGSISIDLGYGLAASTVISIDIDDQTSADEDIGAIITISFSISHSNNNSYAITQGTDMDLLMDTLIDDSIPSNAEMILSVYDNDGNEIFTESYDQAEIMALLELEI